MVDAKLRLFADIKMWKAQLNQNDYPRPKASAPAAKTHRVIQKRLSVAGLSPPKRKPVAYRPTFASTAVMRTTRSIPAQRKRALCNAQKFAPLDSSSTPSKLMVIHH